MAIETESREQEPIVTSVEVVDGKPVVVDSLFMLVARRGSAGKKPTSARLSIFYPGRLELKNGKYYLNGAEVEPIKK